jgi:hypothetical protein
VDGTTHNKVFTPSGEPVPGESLGQQIFGWFGKILPASFFALLKQDLEIIENSCIFILPVTTWLMIMQRLSQKGTLATAVSELLQGNGRELPDPCKQVLEGRISANTGACSQARQRVPVEPRGAWLSEPSSTCMRSRGKADCGTGCFFWMAAPSGWRTRRRS